MKYRKKPVVIEAWQATEENYRQGVPEFIRQAHNVRFVVATPQYGGMLVGGEIDTLEGKHSFSRNDYIIKGVKGEFYPCKPDIFEMTYEQV